MKLFITSRTRN